MTSTSVRPSGYKQPARDPSTAAMLSLIPGLGQLYNGETRKGFLFLGVTCMNSTLFLGMCFVDQILGGLRAFSEGFHMKPNTMLIRCMSDAHFGSVVFVILL